MICCILPLRCFPYWMPLYLRSLVCGCVVSPLLFCRVDGWCGFQCDCDGGGDYRNGEFDDFVELNHLVLFLRRIDLPPT